MADFTGGIPLEHTPVLVVGASMVGMTLSALLAKHGIQGCIAVEKHAGTAIHPRAALFHPRTMQIYRELGLYDAMCEESSKHYDQHAGIVDVESLAGKFLRSWMSNMNEGIEDMSPTVRLFLTQQMFEPILRAKVVGDGVDLRFSTEMVEFQQDAGGVTALLRNTETGRKTLVRARYMVACEGNRSSTRSKLGIEIKGHGLLSHSITIYFQADLGKYVKGKYNGVIYVNNPEVRGFFRLDKNGTEGFLVVFTAGQQGTEESRFPADGITEEKAKRLLRAAIGADVAIEITLISPWRAVCDIAEEFCKGKILLAGDAAHTVTPHGGFGGNTGIQDAHNLAWKLAFVLKGQAHPSLVEETYHAERHPISQKTVDQVFERYLKRTAPELDTDDVQVEEEIPEPHLELGYRYHSRALETTVLSSITEDPSTTISTPGSIARHVVVGTDDAGNPTALADYFGTHFVLLAGPDGESWEAAAKALAQESELPLPEVRVHRVDSEKFCERYGISTSGAVLVRPDSMVAWRSVGPALFGRAAMGVPDPAKTLLCVMRKILCFTPAASATHGVASSTSEEQKTSPSLATAVFDRERQLQSAREQLQRELEQMDAHLADVRRLSKLQDEMAMLAMKIMPEGEGPPSYS